MGSLTAGAFARVAEAVGPPPDSAFQKVTLNDRPGQPMDLAVLPDGDVLHTTKEGVIWRNDSRTGVNEIAGRINVYAHDEEGLHGIELAPGFDGRRNNWVYLFYSPPMDTPVDDPATQMINEGDAPILGTEEDFKPFEGVIRLSRFRFRSDHLRNATEQQILEVPVDRGIGNHLGGDIVFDSSGNLLLSTGDDTPYNYSDDFAPIDERPDHHPALDAQRSSANTNDLRGKILRITPAPGGGYTIPEGNLFEPGTPRTRPEIYVMGLRNPFRIEVDPRTDALLLADYSPDASMADPARGPAGHGKWTTVEQPGNYGWPYCATAELPYVDYDFATGISGEAFDCDAPVNESPHNTGRTRLPPVVQPDLWYGYGPSAEFPELGTGGVGPMSGPVYDFDRKDVRRPRPVAWPHYYDGVALFYDWTRDWIKGMHVEDGKLAAIEDVVSSIVTAHPMDMEFGRNGALYVLEFGDFAENRPQLSRIDYIGTGGNHSPVPVIAAERTSGTAPLEVSFSSEGTHDPDGDRLRYAWDFEGDGKIDSTDPDPNFTYTGDGAYRATLKITDVGGRHRGRHASADIDIVIGN